MNPSVIVVPLAIVSGGVAAFFLAPLEGPLRLGLLLGDLLAAGVVGVILWRRNRG
jgi:hypothetical protein